MTRIVMTMMTRTTKMTYDDYDNYDDNDDCNNYDDYDGGWQPGTGGGRGTRRMRWFSRRRPHPRSN